MKPKVTAIDLDGVERLVLDIAARHRLTRRAVELRLVPNGDGPKRFREIYKPGPKPKQQEEK